jgi:hypothetical protein
MYIVAELAYRSGTEKRCVPPIILLKWYNHASTIADSNALETHPWPSHSRIVSVSLPMSPANQSNARFQRELVPVV